MRAAKVLVISFFFLFGIKAVSIDPPDWVHRVEMRAAKCTHPDQIYDERPIPKGIHSQQELEKRRFKSLSDDEINDWFKNEQEQREKSANLFGWKYGWLLTRYERHRSFITAVYLSTELDDCDEYSGGGYWIARSRDGGKTWPERYYTGVEEKSSHRVLHKSEMKMVKGSDIFLEVEQRGKKNYILHFDWHDLTRDRDKDGLTDLLEQTLCTDPDNPDSDGDGIPDGIDLMPLMPRHPAISRKEKLFCSLLELSKPDSRAVIVNPVLPPWVEVTYLDVEPADCDIAAKVVALPLSMVNQEDSSIKYRSTVVLLASNFIQDETQADVYADIHFQAGNETAKLAAAWVDDHWKITKLSWNIAD